MHISIAHEGHFSLYFVDNPKGYFSMISTNIKRIYPKVNRNKHTRFHISAICKRNVRECFIYLL